MNANGISRSVPLVTLPTDLQLPKCEGAPEVLRLRDLFGALVSHRSRRLALVAPQRAAVGQGAGGAVQAERHPYR